MEYAKLSKHFTLKIIIGMILGITFGILLKNLNVQYHWLTSHTIQTTATLGELFLRLIKMIIVPLVFISLVCGSASMGDFKTMGRIGIKSLAVYLLTTAVAIAIALWIASMLHVGANNNPITNETIKIMSPPPLQKIILNIIPTNPIAALTEGNMLQIIVFALLIGISSLLCGEPGRKIITGFTYLNTLMIKLTTMILEIAPYGVFCLLTTQFSTLPFSAISNLLGYFLTVLGVLIVQLIVVYSLILYFSARLNPLTFIRKLYGALTFAFSTSSSVASIPIVLKAVTNKLGVSNKVASFVIPVGATINMDGTAIMQGVATVFIANLYHIPLSITAYVTVIAMATIASIGTAGVPGVGLITLMMVLQQVGLPVEGIAMIIGIDRLLDMARTAVNISGDAMISCIVANSEDELNKNIFSS